MGRSTSSGTSDLAIQGPTDGQAGREGSPRVRAVLPCSADFVAEAYEDEGVPTMREG